MAPGTAGSGNTTRTKVSPSAGGSSPSIVKGKGRPTEAFPSSFSAPITIRHGELNQRDSYRDDGHEESCVPFFLYVLGIVFVGLPLFHYFTLIVGSP